MRHTLTYKHTHTPRSQIRRHPLRIERLDFRLTYLCSHICIHTFYMFLLINIHTPRSQICRHPLRIERLNIRLVFIALFCGAAALFPPPPICQVTLPHTTTSALSHAHIHAHVKIQTDTHRDTQRHTETHRDTQRHTETCTRTRTHANIHIHIHTCTHPHIHTHLAGNSVVGAMQIDDTATSRLCMQCVNVLCYQPPANRHTNT